MGKIEKSIVSFLFFPRHLLMATAGDKTLTALDLNRYRHSYVVIMLLI